MNKNVIILLILSSFIFCFSCKKHMHNYIDGVCSCGDIKKCAVEYSLNNGSSNIKIEYKFGDKITRPEKPEKDGFVFLDWYYENKSYEFNQPIYNNLRLEAKWAKDVNGSQEIEYELSEDKTYYIVKKVTDLGVNSISIPSKFNGLPVKEVKNDAFRKCTALENFTFTSSIKKFGIDVFEGTNVKNVYYVGSIYDWCCIEFAYDENILTSPTGNPACFSEKIYFMTLDEEYKEILDITLPNDVEKIGDYQFYGFKNINSVNFSNSIKLIGSFAFSNCESIKEIKVPEGVTSIGMCAFSDCSNLKNISLPTSLNFVGYKVFNRCEQVVYNSIGNEQYLGNSLNKYLVLVSVIDDEIENYVVKDETKIILDRVFECKNLKTLEIHNNVTNVGPYLSTTGRIDSIYYNGNIEDWLNIKMEFNSSNPVRFANKLYIKDENNNYNELVDLVIPETITVINKFQFCGFESITSVTLHENIEYIDTEAFMECINLKTIYNYSKLEITKKSYKNGAIGYYAENIYTK